MLISNWKKTFGPHGIYENILELMQSISGRVAGRSRVCKSQVPSTVIDSHDSC